MLFIIRNFGDFFTSIIIPSYAYTYIKIGFLNQLIIDDVSLAKLKTFSNIQEFIEFIRPYYPEIIIKKYSIIEIEQSLFHTLIKLIGKILFYSPESMRRFLSDYLLKFEIANIKQVIMGVITGLNIKEITKQINFSVEEYLEHKEFMNNLLEITSLDEIQLFMSKTRYNKAIREGILYFRNNNEIFVMQAFLDQYYYNNLLEQEKSYDKKERAMISSYIYQLIEVYNLRMISRGITNNIDKDLLKQFLVKGYFFLDENIINTLMNLNNIEDFYQQIENYLKKSPKLQTAQIPIVINKRHLIWSLGAIYQNYFFKINKLKIDDIENSTIYRILELMIKKDKEIKFNIMPNIIRIIHEKFERLENKYGNL
ncbi:MAG: V-type ATPase subunit [Candidatus Lokiarchaeota archaeon]|nr:V-type ATPase subunit [Candidatus Lokiarchaeota archaeon]